jgi:serine/threonine protein kinase
MPRREQTPLTVLGEYDLLEQVGAGAVGTVYRAWHRPTQRVVAVKVMTPETAAHPVHLKRFEQEFRAARDLHHPNLVRTLDFCGAPPTPFLVMEFVEGESLGQQLERRGRLPEAEAVGLIVQVCLGLHVAHLRGLIHRDVKPDNILVTPEGTAKLTDLGLIKAVDADADLTRTGRGLGTPHFMAPEQFRNAKHADIRCDVYSLGATLYQTVTGELPFGKASGPLDAWLQKTRDQLPRPRQRCPQLSERVDYAIWRALRADPSLRPASCQELVGDLLGSSALDISLTKWVAPADPVSTDPTTHCEIVRSPETESQTSLPSADDSTNPGPPESSRWVRRLLIVLAAVALGLALGSVLHLTALGN